MKEPSQVDIAIGEEVTQENLEIARMIIEVIEITESGDRGLETETVISINRVSSQEIETTRGAKDDDRALSAIARI